MIDQLKALNPPQKNPASAPPDPGPASNQPILDRLDRLEGQMTEISIQLQKIEAALPAGKSD
jgi:hypothetical protein